MTSSKLFDNPTVPPLRRLIEDVIEGGILVPEFQRDFIWKDDQRLDLLDSVLCGMPIGSLLVWRTTLTTVRHQERIGPRAVRTDALRENQIMTRTFLLDGLQRVSTLVGALAPREGPDEDEQDDGDDKTRWTIYYDLAAKAGTSTRDRLTVRSRHKGVKPERTQLPLHLVLDDYDMGEFQDKLKEHIQDPDARRVMVRESQRIAAVIKDYPVPVVPIVSDDLNVVTASFQRVNSMGTRMSEEDMAAALTFARAINLPEKIAKLKSTLGDVGWAELDSQVVLASLKVLLSIEPSKPQPAELQTKLVEAQERGDNPFDSLTQRMLDAVQLLGTRCDIRGPAVLPYAYQLVSLCEAAGFQRFAEDDVSTRYAQWLWATTVSEHFAGMNSTQIRLAIQFARELGEIPVNELATKLQGEVGTEPVRRVTRYNFNAARTRAFCVMLARHADQVAQDSRSLELLGSAGNGAVQVLVRGRPQSEPGNRVILPPKELSTLRDVLRGPDIATAQSQAERHMVPLEALDALRAKADADFVRIRGAYLWEQEKRFIESRAPSVFTFED